MPDVAPIQPNPQSSSRRLPKYLIPVIICLAGVILFITIALAPIGIIVFFVGLIWAAIEFWVDRVTDTDTPAKRDAERKEIG